MGRRVRKRVYTWDDGAGQWNLTLTRKFVWSGWLKLMELDGSNDAVRKYTWGLDLAGQNGAAASEPGAGATGLRQGAGGTLDTAASRQGQVGGLLSVYDADEEDDYVYLYDANGNVGQVVDLGAACARTAIVAHYEYDPYGNRTNTAAQGEYEQPFRHSTKYFDDESGLSDFGRRYYHAGLGRWLNRDPIGELGGQNVYAYALNDPVNRGDYLGLNPLCPKDDDDADSPTDTENSPPPLPDDDDLWQDDDDLSPKPVDYSDCWTYCQSNAVKKLFNSMGGPDGLVVCRPDGCKCACPNMNSPQHRAPKDYVEEAKWDCVVEHEEYHIEDGVTCNWCLSYPCVARHTLGTSEFRAYLAQIKCLYRKKNDPRCIVDYDCQEKPRKEIDLYRTYMKVNLGCWLSF